MTINSRKVTTFPFNHSDQPDHPTFPNTAALKTALDSRSETMRLALNGLIDDLMSIVSGSSGAKQLGASSVTGFAGNDVQTILDNIANTLKSVTSGSSGAESIGSSTITGVAGATIYAQLASLKALVDAVYTKAQLDGGQLDNRYYTESELNSVSPGSSGAHIIGSAPISGVTGATVYAQLANIFAQLQGIVIGTLPDGSVTPVKLSFVPATQAGLDGLAGSGRTTETVKGNADALVLHKAEKAIDASPPHGMGKAAAQDYEEGIWTPVLECSSTPGTHQYAEQLGRYTRTGRVVVIHCFIRLTEFGSDSGGSARISGLPFVANSNLPRSVCTFKPYNVGLSTNFTQFTAYVTHGTNRLGLFQLGSNQAETNLLSTHFPSGVKSGTARVQIEISAAYEI